MRDLVDLALVLRQLSGDATAAMDWAQALGARGKAALPALGVRGDPALVLVATAQEARLIRADGTGDRVRAAEVVLVLDLMGSLPDVPAPVLPDRDLVFTVPQSVEHLVQPRQRLDLLVTDVIARAHRTLHVGGPFWNQGGWELLKPVVLPALKTRAVRATFYLHPSESGHLQVVEDMLEEARSHGDVRALWWTADVPSLMHAKFVVADGSAGYFGTANLTSLGLSEHLEMGVGLAPTQATSLLELLADLEEAGMFQERIT